MTKLFSILFLGLLACKPSLEVKQKDQFNFDSLVRVQAKWLNHQDVDLKKLTSVGNVNVVESILDSNKIKWEKELAPFLVIDWVNKPAYRDNYQVSILQDDKSNLKIKYWNAEAKGPPIRTLKVSYLNKLDKIKSIEAVLEEESLGFTSHKQMRLQFSLFGGKTVLESYKISAYQKFFIGGGEYFTIEGIVLRK